MTTSHSLSVETLGRITVLQSMVTLMPNKISMLDFVCQGLKDVTGVKSLAYRLFDGSTPPPIDSVRSAETMRVFPIKYNAVTHAELNFEIAESEAFDPYIPFLQNFVNMLGVVFEGQTQRKLNETLLEELEQRVTERTSALQKKTEDLRITLNSIGDAVISTDTYGIVTNMNPVAEKLTGWKIVDGIGRNLTDVFQIINAVTLQPTLNQVKRVLATGEIVGLANHTSLIAKDGTRYQIADSAAPIRDIEGNICGVVLVFRDVSDEYRITEALRSSEERFLLAMKASNDGLFDWNLETNDIYYSPAWKKMLGYKDHELPNDFSVWENTTDPEDAKKSWELQQKLISKQIDRFVFEFKMKHKDGHWVDILSRAEAVFNDSGKAVRIVGTHVDLTKRKQAETELRKSEEKFRTLVNAAPFGIQLTDLEGRIVYSNPAHHKIQGYGPHELTGMYIWDLVANDSHRAKTREYYQTIMSKKPEPTVYFSRDRTRDGREIDLQINWDYIRNEKDEVTDIISIIDEITDRKRAEEELLESKALLESVIENIPLMIFLKEPKDLRFVMFNHAGEELLGYDRKNLIGKNNLDLFPDEQAAFFMAKDREVLNGGVDILDIPEETILTANKGTRLLHTKKVCIKNSDGTAKYLLGISEDITEHKKMERQNLLLADIITRSQDFIGVADQEMNAIYVNPAGMAMVGLDGDEAVRKSKISKGSPGA
jgi:PAS domain S-box-containing protein